LVDDLEEQPQATVANDEATVYFEPDLCAKRGGRYVRWNILTTQ
jgi:hypothetical protein